MDDKDKILLDAIHQAELLGQFKEFCNKFEGDPIEYHNIINIMHRSGNKKRTLHQIFKNYLKIELKEDDEDYMMKLVDAFFKKKDKRKAIPYEIRIQLLNKQNRKCAFCGDPVDEHDHVDHIVPFKYVGDELEDNYQILCQTCNLHKNESIDYQIKFILNL